MRKSTHKLEPHAKNLPDLGSKETHNFMPRWQVIVDAGSLTLQAAMDEYGFLQQATLCKRM